MALLNSLACLSCACVLGALAIAVGSTLLDHLGVSIESTLEKALFSAGTSFAAIQVIMFILLATGLLSFKFLLLLLLALALMAGRGWVFVGQLVAAAFSFLLRKRGSQLAFPCTLGIVFFLLLDGLMSMAPLTGSDALNYHFTVPSLWLRDGFAPIFGITLSFAVGQAHMLILMGLTLGSDRIALGMIFLGGVFTVASFYVLARRWMSPEFSLLGTLTFLLTPMVFWQMTVAGSPDIWMAFYTTMAVLAAGRGIASRSARWVMLSGFLAGAAAGSKYPAWAIPMILGIMFLLETRSAGLAGASAIAELLTGVWPLLRNAWWTGDPFFPFLSRWLAPHQFNPNAIAMVLADTMPHSGRSDVLSWAEYPFHMILQGRDYGVGHYFGPLVLAFAPLLAFVYRREPLFRVAAAIWGGTFFLNALNSQMARFLLPIFVIALAMVLAGVEAATRLRPSMLRWTCMASIATFLIFCAVSYATYSRNFLPVSLGMESEEHFLMRESPEYQEAAFVNRVLQGKPGATLIFLRHTYYLHLRYLQGDADRSFEVNPEKLQTPEAILAWLRKSGVRWVVKTGAYPTSVQSSLNKLESDGQFQPITSGLADYFNGFRIDNNINKIVVQIFEVRPTSTLRRDSK